MKYIITSVVALLLTISTTFANASTDPKSMLETVANNITDYLSENKDKVAADQNIAVNLVKNELVPYIDQEALGRRVLAREWNNATPEQQKIFVEKFVDLVIDTYAKGLAQYDGQTFEFENTEYNKAKDAARVKSQMKQQKGEPVKIDYYLKKPKGMDEWRVVDVRIEGISMATSYRNQFAQQIKQEGLDSVIKKLANNEIELK